MSNALEQLKADPAFAPGPGQEKEVPLSTALRERYPGLRVTMTCRPSEQWPALRRVRIVATEERLAARPRVTSVEVLIRAKGAGS